MACLELHGLICSFRDPVYFGKDEANHFKFGTKTGQLDHHDIVCI